MGENLTEIGFSVTKALDDLGVKHSYFSVADTYISIDVYPPQGLVVTFFVRPIPSVMLPEYLARLLDVVSADFRQMDKMNNYSSYPDWAKYVVDQQILLTKQEARRGGVAMTPNGDGG